jgi:hypothetical protein
MSRNRFMCSLSLVVLAIVSAPAHADSIIAQNGPHDQENVLPFGSDLGSGRYQQVYASALFSEPVFIESLAFSSPWDFTYTANNFKLSLTTTNMAVGGLSPNLDDNVTAPLTVMINSSVSIPMTSGVDNFGLVFNFPTRFLYDPSHGNVLLDIEISDHMPWGFFGVSADIGGTVASRAYSFQLSPAAADRVALRTQIGFTPVPEPTSGMFLPSIIAFGSLWRCRAVYPF